MHEYGAWKSGRGGAKGEMLFNILERIEALSKTKIVWAAGIDQRDVQAAEYRELPGAKPGANCSCAMVLARVLEPLRLSYKIIQRDLSAELYEQAKECFNELRKIDPRSKYGEKSLFLLALNYQQQHELERMKVVLKEYLKTFDQPGSEHFHEACFWVGWALEQERKYREACHYYAKAAEERIVVYRPAAGTGAASAPAAAGKPLPREQLALQLSHEALVALEEPVSGQFKGVKLDPDVFDFVRINTNVKMRLEGGPAEAGAVVTGEAFRKVPCLEVICQVLDSLGLAMRVENVGKTIADRAYYRLAACYQKDWQNDQVLEACNALLARFPETARKRDAYKLKLEIHKALRDYRNVLATLADLRDKCPEQVEAYKQDFEIGWIHFDLCRYDMAVESFRKSLAAAKDPAERTKIRDGYARALLRVGNMKEALAQYQTLAGEEAEPLRQFVAAMMKAYLQAALDNLPQMPLPEYAEKLIIAYESLSDAQRERLSKADLAKATWIYYLAALTDLRAGRAEAAMRKLTASANSPDDSVAGDASYLLATIHMKRGDLRKAREVLEDLLFTARTTEAEVKGTYALATCLAGLGESDKAAQRLRQIVDRFPDSPYADQARQSPLMKKGATTTSKPAAP
jgi:tetratricopeptide (TPR) repeat protein